MRNWEDMPSSTNVQDMTYGPQQPVAPWSMGPKQPPMTRPSFQGMMFGPQRAPLTAAQYQWLQQNLPPQLPTNPIAGSMPSGLMFTKGGQILPQSGPTQYTSMQSDPLGQHRIAESAQNLGTTLNTVPWGMGAQ